MFLKSSEQVNNPDRAAHVWKNCTVVQGNKLWTVDDHAVLHIWELNGKGSHVADVVLRDLDPTLNIYSTSTMSVSEDCSIVAITTQRIAGPVPATSESGNAKNDNNDNMDNKLDNKSRYFISC
jgi:hypothetical protein